MASAYFFLRLKKKTVLLTNKNQNFEELKTESLVINSSIDQNLSLKCIVCLKDGKISVYSNKYSFNICESLSIFTDTEVFEEDSLPKYICESCFSLLQNAIMLRKLAKLSNSYLKELLVNRIDEAQSLYEPENFNGSDEKLEDLIQVYNCETCQVNFESRDEFMKHKSSKQHKNVRIQCKICKSLITVSLFQKHLDRHQSATHLVCHVCGKVYRKDNLVRHMQLHSLILPYQCRLCPYRGRFLESLRIHMRTHTGLKPFCCDKCQSSFLTRSNLNRHLLTHLKEKPFKCKECGRGFYTNKDLNTHIKSDHVGIKENNCRICGSKYGSRKALMRHEIRVHNRNKMSKGRMPLYLQSAYKEKVNNIKTV